MLTEVTEAQTTLQMPTLGEKVQKLLPIPMTPKEVRRRMIEAVAEELHPGCWDLGDVEPRLKRVFDSCIRYDRCRCDHCQNSNFDRCENNNGRPIIKRLIIRIPETTIRNERDESTPIKDFYIAVAFNDDYSKALTTQMFSMRSTVTTKEYACGVFHPHSQSRDNNYSLEGYFSWRAMCLGGQTELTDIMYTLYHDGISKKPLFELLLLLHVYASWESIDGGPYRRMNNWAYPTSSNGERTRSLPIKLLSNTMLTLLASTDDIPRPDMIGDGSGLAITNVATAITPLVKRALVEYTDESLGYRPTVLQYLGSLDDRGRFSPLNLTGSGRRPTKPREFYLQKIEEMASFNENHAESILKFKGGTTFVMTLDENGLGEAREVTDTDIQAAQVHPDAVRYLTDEYINKFKQFKSSYNF